MNRRKSQLIPCDRPHHVGTARWAFAWTPSPSSCDSWAVRSICPHLIFSSASTRPTRRSFCRCSPPASRRRQLGTITTKTSSSSINSNIRSITISASLSVRPRRPAWMHCHWRPHRQSPTLSLNIPSTIGYRALKTQIQYFALFLFVTRLVEFCVLLAHIGMK